MADTVLMIRSGLFRLILSFLHIVYSGLEYFDTAWALFKRKLENVSQSKCTDTLLYVSRFVTNLEKCPNHFAVILGNEAVSFEDFSNLIIWCFAAGISFITFYDYTGYLKDNEDLYYKYLVSGKKLDENCVIFNVNVNGTKNGYKKNGYTKKIHVNILSIENGKELFSNLVRKICEKAMDNEIAAGDINESYIDEEMRKMVSFSDPDLAVICSSVCATFGFLPWHIRLTEFLQVPTIENIRASDFTAMLKKYSMCSQRFGR